MFARRLDSTGKTVVTTGVGSESPFPLSQSDLSDWEANYGTVATLSATSAAVPEPTTTTLALVALCLVIGRRFFLDNSTSTSENFLDKPTTLALAALCLPIGN